MLNRFLTFSTNISQAYKYMTKIKSHYMSSMGLKAAHGMCLLHIGFHEEGLTAVELSTLCAEDKAAISKNLAALKAMDLICGDDENGGKVYRVKYRVTEKGAAVHKEISDYVVEAVEVCSAGMTFEEGANFYRAFNSVVENMKTYYHDLDKEESAT